MICTCKDCLDRFPGCHAGCEKYKAWKAEREALLADEKAKNHNDGQYIEYLKEAKKRIKLYHKPKKR